MPGRSSATKEEPARSGPPLSLLGATGGTSQDDQATDPTAGSWSVSPATTTVAEGAHRREKYSLLVHIFTTRGRRSLEPHAWVEDLLRDFFQLILGINLSVILLSPTECLIFCGNHAQGQGMSWDESLQYIHQLMGVHPWTSYMIDVVAYQRTLKEARHEMQVEREFTHQRTKQRITHLNVLAMGPAAKARLAMPKGSPRGRGMTRRANRYFIQQQLGEMNLEESTFAQCPTLLGAQQESPDREQFDSAWEDAEEDGKATSTLDAKLDASTGEETGASWHPAQTPSAEWRRRRNRTMHRERTCARKEFRRPKNRCLSFPLFRETTKEDAISYRDWHSEIEDALEHGHDAAKVKEAMFASLEGMAGDNAKMIDENVFYAALCGLQQRQMESARAYYNRMVQITIILRERHGNRYRPGELARMSKDCFYAGLLPKNHPMVVHLKDQPRTTPLDLLKALLEQEENDTLMGTRYTPSTSSRTSQLSKPAEHYHRQLPAEKRNDGYTVHPAQLDADSTEAVPEVDSAPLNDTLDALETWYNDGFLIGLRQAAEVSEL